MVQGFWMAFGDLPQRIILPTIISVAVLGLECIAVWVVLNPREEPRGYVGSDLTRGDRFDHSML